MSKLLGIVVGVHIQVVRVVVVCRSVNARDGSLAFPHGTNDLVHIGKKPSGRSAFMIGSLNNDFLGLMGNQTWVPAGLSICLHDRQTSLQILHSTCKPGRVW